jgi:hypothetical protein
MNFVVYELKTGKIFQSGSCDDSQFDIQRVPDGYAILPIEADPFNQYIENNQAISMSEKPADWYIFDYSLKKWADPISPEQKYKTQAEKIVNSRNFLLEKSDWTQIPNNALTIGQQQAWADYRQQLRDITSQAGYPFEVVWPVSPQG